MQNVPKETPVSGLVMNSAVLEIKRSGYFSYTKKGIWKMAQREKAEHSCCFWLTHCLCCLWHLSGSLKSYLPPFPGTREMRRHEASEPGILAEARQEKVGLL